MKKKPFRARCWLHIWHSTRLNGMLFNVCSNDVYTKWCFMLFARVKTVNKNKNKKRGKKTAFESHFLKCLDLKSRNSNNATAFQTSFAFIQRRKKPSHFNICRVRVLYALVYLNRCRKCETRRIMIHFSHWNDKQTHQLFSKNLMDILRKQK